MDADLSVAGALKRAAELCGGQSALAAAVGITGPSPRATVWAWIDRGRVPAEHCAAIEQATLGAVTRRDLRPDDWHRIWPELIAAEGAPAAPLETRTDLARPVEAA
jgi:DNA-binding transcriptional regulator YdaS (Cro superfamily)